MFSFAKIIFHAPLLCQIITLKARLTEVNKFKAHFKNTAFVHVQSTEYERTKQSLMIQQCERKDVQKKLHLILLHTFLLYSCFMESPQISVREVLSSKPPEYLKFVVNEVVISALEI